MHGNRPIFHLKSAKSEQKVTNHVGNPRRNANVEPTTQKVINYSIKYSFCCWLGSFTDSDLFFPVFRCCLPVRDPWWLHAANIMLRVPSAELPAPSVGICCPVADCAVALLHRDLILRECFFDSYRMLCGSSWYSCLFTLVDRSATER